MFQSFLKFLGQIKVTIAILLINTLVFAFQMHYGSLDALHLFNLGGFQVNAVVQNHDFFRLFAPTFLHLSTQHIVFNNLALLGIGLRTEPVVGSSKFLLLYLLTGVLAYAIALLLTLGSMIAVGASGALMGLLGYRAVMQYFDPALVREGSFNDILLIGFQLLSDALSYSHIGLFFNPIHVGGLIGGIAIAGAVLLIRSYKKPIQFTLPGLQADITQVVLSPTVS